MAKTTFTTGTVVSPDFLNAINNPIFAESADNDGELPLITNNDLSGVAGQIKPEWTTYRDTLKVTAGAGLSVNYTGGAVQLPTGISATIAPNALTLPNDSTSYVFVAESGVVATATVLPTICLLLASVVTAGGSVSTISDHRPRFIVRPQTQFIKVLGGTGGQGDYTLTGTATLSDGLYYFRNFTIQAGATLTVSKFAKIYCSGNVTISGTIIVTPAANGGAGASISAAGTYIPTKGDNFGSGGFITGGSAYNYGISPVGSGGGSGYIPATSGSAATVSAGRGGHGGGGLWIEAGGTITLNSSAIITATGDQAVDSTLVSGSGVYMSTGAGGGSGGTIVLISAIRTILNAGATISCAGGAGSSGVSTNASFGVTGGGGGGGGQIILISPTVPLNNATITLSGGAGGAPVGNTSALFGGGTGGGNGGAGGSANGGTSANTGLPGSVGKLFVGTFVAIGG